MQKCTARSFDLNEPATIMLSEWMVSRHPCSIEGEEVPFNTFIEPAKANGAVEKWLCEVESSMIEAVEKQCAAGVRAYATTERKKWVLEWPGQVVLLGSQIYWTRDIAEALRNAEVTRAA